ncbi:MAG TPA: hypothetical protein VMF53_00375 [Alphaproteobacteria bacterium]|nr:hypothetical protein [Alphaproteobacteria bacterium]
MSVGPVSGNGIPFTLTSGKTCFWAVTVQASWTQFVQLKDPTGKVVFTASGSGGTGGAPKQIGAGNFVAIAGNYMMYIGINNGQQWSQVIWDDDALTTGGTVYYQCSTFIAEDGGGTDYNDSCVQIAYFNSLG